MPENAVMQQTAGQAYWINRGCAQHVLTACVPLTPQQARDGWALVCQQEYEQQQLWPSGCGKGLAAGE